jgi:hypothetical protein
LLDGAATCDQQRIDLAAHSPEVLVRHHAQSGVGREHRVPRAADDFNAINGGRAGMLLREQPRRRDEDLERSDQVKDLSPLGRDQRDAPRARALCALVLIGALPPFVLARH